MRKRGRIGTTMAGVCVAASLSAGCEPQVVDVSFALQSEGGFAGTGDLQCFLAADMMTVIDNGAGPSLCARDAPAEVTRDLLAAAQAVDWDSIAPSYRPADRPYCDPDAYVYDLEVSVTWGDGNSTLVRTTWCGQAEAPLPDAFAAFLSAADTLCRQILELC